MFEKDPSDPANQSSQIRDYNPGIPETPGGLFWTTFIDADHVDWSDSLKSAEWAERNFALFDFHDIGNAVQDGAHRPGAVTFSMRWFDAGDKQHTRDANEHFDVSFRPTKAEIAWSGQTDGGGSFTSDAASTSKSLFGMLGKEQNGVFFNNDDDDDDDDEDDD